MKFHFKNNILCTLSFVMLYLRIKKKEKKTKIVPAYIQIKTNLIKTV